jgi:hypothetical protein
LTLTDAEFLEGAAAAAAAANENEGEADTNFICSLLLRFETCFLNDQVDQGGFNPLKYQRGLPMREAAARRKAMMMMATQKD